MDKYTKQYQNFSNIGNKNIEGAKKWLKLNETTQYPSQQLNNNNNKKHLAGWKKWSKNEHIQVELKWKSRDSS